LKAVFGGRVRTLEGRRRPADETGAPPFLCRNRPSRRPKEGPTMCASQTAGHEGPSKLTTANRRKYDFNNFSVN
jgi:hypothetical protein